MVAAIPSLFGIFVYNDLTAIVTKIELTGTEKLFTLLMKWFVSFIYEGICFPRAGDGDQRISKFLMCYTQLNFITGLPGLFGLWIFGEM